MSGKELWEINLKLMSDEDRVIIGWNSEQSIYIYIYRQHDLISKRERETQ